MAPDVDDIPGAPRRDGDSVVTLHRQLREAIISGQLRAGAAYSQAELGTRFGAGRTPLREALRQLQRDGLVLADPRRSVRIAPLAADDFEELCVMRIALEAVAVAITVPTLGAADLAALEGDLAQMDFYAARDDPAGLRHPHRDFHRRLVAGVGPRLLAEADELAEGSERYRRAFSAYGDPAESRREHRAILDAVVAGEAALAAHRVAGHYARTGELALTLLDPGRGAGRIAAALAAVGADAVALGRADPRRGR